MSKIEPKTTDEAFTGDDWIISMEEELHQLLLHLDALLKSDNDQRLGEGTT